MHGRREKRGREAGFPRWREAGEKEKNYATLRNISQSKKCKEAGANKYRAETGIKGYRKQEVQTPLSPPPPPHKVSLSKYTPASKYKYNLTKMQHKFIQTVSKTDTSNSKVPFMKKPLYFWHWVVQLEPGAPVIEVQRSAAVWVFFNININTGMLAFETQSLGLLKVQYKQIAY